MEFGVFLLMQSPSARPSAEIYGRAIEIAQAAEELGFSKVWVAEHHFILRSMERFSRDVMPQFDGAAKVA